MPSFCGPASAEERKGNESDGRFTQDQHLLQKMMPLPMTLRSGGESEEPLWRGFQDEEVEEFLRKRLCLQRNILIEWASQGAQ